MNISHINATHIYAFVDDHHLIYGLPVLYMLVLTLVVKWVLRGPRDTVIDMIYLPETIRLTDRFAHKANLRS